MPGVTYNDRPYHPANLKRHAVAGATLTAYANTVGANGFEVYVTSAAAIDVAPQGGEADIQITPAAGVLPYKVPFLCSAIRVTSVATWIAVY